MNNRWVVFCFTANAIELKVRKHFNMVGNEKKTSQKGGSAGKESLLNSKIFKKLPLKSLLLTVAVIALIMTLPNFRSQGALAIGMDDTRLGINHSIGGSTEAEYADIESIELVSSVDIGHMISGIGDEKSRSGIYENEIFGTYELYQYIAVESFIVIYKSDSVLMFNLSSIRKTEKFYEDLMESYNTYAKK